MIRTLLTLDYALNEGWLAPWLDGLRSGRLVGARCADCAAISFPPEKVCACGGPSEGWVPLSGAANIVWRSTGSDGDFALVKLDDAATHTVARVDKLAPDARRCMIVAGQQDLAIVAGPLLEDQ